MGRSLEPAGADGVRARSRAGLGRRGDGDGLRVPARAVCVAADAVGQLRHCPPTLPRRLRRRFSRRGIGPGCDLGGAGLGDRRGAVLRLRERDGRPDDFYKVKQQEYSVAPALVVPLSQRARFSLGPSVKLTETRLERGTFIDSLAPYGVGRLRRIGARADLRVDARNRPRAASAGAFLDVGGSAYPAAWDVTAPFEEAHADAAVYLTAPIPTRPTLALRAQGKKVWGRYPFDEAAYVGGATTVRGFAERRFAGDAALAGSAELRLSLFRLFALLPEQFGVFGLGDVGRVYLTGESSDRWHAGLGGGAWIAFLSPVNTLSVAAAASGSRFSVRETRSAWPTPGAARGAASTCARGSPSRG
ncbi:MAG: hypothetical protein DMD36_13535 [Gemmatimonadetes bacterium]|nr:MAG: hypothetical protein DMD36_13535 [Gemmatimonadota bacterium]